MPVRRRDDTPALQRAESIFFDKRWVGPQRGKSWKGAAGYPDCILAQNPVLTGAMSAADVGDGERLARQEAREHAKGSFGRRAIHNADAGVLGVDH